MKDWTGTLYPVLFVPRGVPVDRSFYRPWRCSGGQTTERSQIWRALQAQYAHSSDPNYSLKFLHFSVLPGFCPQKVGGSRVISTWGYNLVFELSKIYNSRVISYLDNGILWNLHLLQDSTSLFIFSFYNPGESHTIHF